MARDPMIDAAEIGAAADYLAGLCRAAAEARMTPECAALAAARYRNRAFWAMTAAETDRFQFPGLGSPHAIRVRLAPGSVSIRVGDGLAFDVLVVRPPLDAGTWRDRPPLL